MTAIAGLSVASFLVTITDHSKKFSIYNLLNAGSSAKATDGTTGGATVAPAAGYPWANNSCAYGFAQNQGPTGNLYGGDAGTLNDGTRYGVKLLVTDPWIFRPRQVGNVIDLRDHYVMADTDNLIFSVTVEYA